MINAHKLDELLIERQLLDIRSSALPLPNPFERVCIFKVLKLSGFERFLGL